MAPVKPIANASASATVRSFIASMVLARSPQAQPAPETVAQSSEMNPGADKSKGVFIGWSGSRSRFVAQALRYWLQCLSKDVEPWVSTLDLRFGRSWWEELESQLQRSQAGILCITPENKESAWLNFEAGALARSVETRLIIPYAIDMSVSDVPSPIGSFQGAAATRHDTLRMISELYASLSVEYDRKGNVFTAFWPLLERVLASGDSSVEGMESLVAEIEQTAIARRHTVIKEVLIPNRIRRGETLPLEYLVQTEAHEVRIWLGASICLAPGEWFYRTDEDQEVMLHRGDRRFRRKLTVSEEIPPGDYDFNAELWFGPTSDEHRSYHIDRKWPAGRISIE